SDARGRRLFISQSSSLLRAEYKCLFIYNSRHASAAVATVAPLQTSNPGRHVNRRWSNPMDHVRLERSSHPHAVDHVTTGTKAPMYARAFHVAIVAALQLAVMVARPAAGQSALS